jgi:hypothetical protein
LKIVDENNAGFTSARIFQSAAKVRDFEVANMELNCNANACAGFPNYGSFTAISVFGDNILIHDCVVKGFGTGPASECFPIFLTAYGTSVPELYINNVVENVVFTQPAFENQNGVTCLIGGGTRKATTRNYIARNCKVLDVISDFSYSQAFTFPEVDSCYVNGCKTGCYYEPGSAHPFELNADFQYPFYVRNSVFTNVIVGVGVAFTSAGTGNMAGLTISRNYISFFPTYWDNNQWNPSYAIGVGGDTTPADVVEQLTVRDNTIKPTSYSFGYVHPYGLALSKAHNVVAERNTINIGTLRGLVYQPSSVTWNSARENRDAMGWLMPLLQYGDTAAPKPYQDP